MIDDLKKNKSGKKEALLRDKLIARLSHEIRTPLNAIMGFTEQLYKTPLSKQQESYLKVIDKSSVFMLEMVNNILEYSKLGSGSVQLDETDFDIEALLRETYTSFKPRAEEKKINLALEDHRNCRGIYRGDAFKLRQVLNNLVSNAIKFTDYGYVSIGAEKVGSHEDGKAAFRFTIKDTGPGIPVNQQKEIFKEYMQASSGISRTHGGAGLGLTISKRLVQLMGGDITVKSTPGKGSLFIIELPLRVSPLKKLSRGIVTVDSEALAGKSALIVDDDSVNRLLGKIILQGFNMQVDLALNGKEAMQMIRSNEYDILLLDIHMPVISGKEVAAFARKQKKDRVRILAVTAEVIRSELDALREAGVDDHLIKPYQEITLFNKLCSLLDIDSRVREDPVQTSHLSISKEPLYDLRSLRSVSRDQEDFFYEMIDTFIENARKGMNELETALSKNDLHQVIETSHRLVPSYKHLEIRSVVSSLLELKSRAQEGADQGTLRNLISRIRLETDAIIEQLGREKP
jgi:CheY-like chemotaxis protein/two-component sensor histidine kinase